MIASYYQINKDQVEMVLKSISISSKELHKLATNKEGIQTHLDIDKSWKYLVAVFKDLKDNTSEINLGEVTFYGKELDKAYEFDGLLNYSDLELVKSVNQFLNSLEIQNKSDFIRTFNSTLYTRFGEIDYSEYYDYLFMHLSNLKRFYAKCEEEESGVIVLIE